MDERIKTLARQGAAHLEGQQLPEALAVYTDLFQLCEEQRRLYPDDSEVQRFWCLTCNGMGLSYSTSGDQGTARAWFYKGLSLCEQLAEAPEAVQAGRDLSIFYGNLGDTFVAERDFSGARVWYEKKWEISQRFAERLDEEVARHDLAIACCKMGLVSRDGERLDWYRKALEMLTRLTEQYPDNALYEQLRETCQKTVRLLENAE